MSPEQCALFVSLAALLGLAIGGGGCFWLVRRHDRQNLNSAQRRSAELIAQAQKDADNLRKEAELKARDETFKKREEFNREVETFRQEQREQERKLEKREDLLDQKHQTQLRKERHLQHSERKLHERREHLEKKVQESEALAQQHLQKLHEITGLSRDQAEKMLLERMDKELADEIAARIQKQNEFLRTHAEEKAREILATAIQRYAAEHT